MGVRRAIAELRAEVRHPVSSCSKLCWRCACASQMMRLGFLLAPRTQLPVRGAACRREGKSAFVLYLACAAGSLVWQSLGASMAGEVNPRCALISCAQVSADVWVAGTDAV